MLEGGSAKGEPSEVESVEAPKRVFVPVELPEEQPWWDRSLVIGLLLAIALNSVGGWYVFRYQPELVEEILAPIEFTILEPPPPPEPEPEPEPTPPPPVVKAKDIPKTPPPTTSTPEPVPTNEPPPPPIFGVSLQSTVKGGSFKTRVGNTIMKEPEKEVTDPADVKALPRVAFHRITKAPRLISEFKAEYPPVPYEEGVEGTVTLTFTVDEEGNVLDVRVLRGVHPDLDAAAKAALRRFKYKPGMQDGSPVITTGMSRNYTWIIEE